jgi:hypothetical protein
MRHHLLEGASSNKVDDKGNNLMLERRSCQKKKSLKKEET